MSKAVEIIKTIMSPANKLIDAVSNAIGKVYEPTHIKRMARAKAYEIEKVGRVLRENADIPIEYAKGEICADTKDFDDLIKRTQSRLAYQEICKQQNIESVTEKAYHLLEGEKECSDEPVDQDWMNRFFNSVEDISNEDMQLLWAKILAGEVKRPQTFSLRTLETLRNLTQEEAKLFEDVCKVVVCSETDCFIPDNENILQKYEITMGDLLLLSDCGLLSSLVTLDAYAEIPADSKEYSIFYGRNKVIKAVNRSSELQKLIITAYPLSRIGEELFELFDSGMPEDDMEELMNSVYASNKKIKINIGEKDK